MPCTVMDSAHLYVNELGSAIGRHSFRNRGGQACGRSAQLGCVAQYSLPVKGLCDATLKQLFIGHETRRQLWHVNAPSS